jgi:hypothetical protein
MRWPIIRPSFEVMQRTEQRAIAADILRSRGTLDKPQPPRSLQSTSSSRSVLLTWYPPAINQRRGIAGWRVYKGSEDNCVMTIKDPFITQATVPASSGQTESPVYTFFVSSVNVAGVESTRIPIQGSALAEDPSASTTAPETVVAPTEQQQTSTESTRNIPYWKLGN